MIRDVQAVIDALGIPSDYVVLGRKQSHLVVGCVSQRTVYRIAVADEVQMGSTPADVRRSHALAVALHRAGLNVLGPIGSEAYRVGSYVVSTSKFVEPLTATGWKSGEPWALGAAMTQWGRVSIPNLRVLDIPAYTADRISDARKCFEELTGLREASSWCEERLDRLQCEYPWVELQFEQGCVHGDPNLGNLVRVPSKTAPQFIDLDCVATGPRYFDLAIMHMYQARFNARYPFGEILAGYERAAGLVDRPVLNALRSWKEFSSQTQLMTRWHSNIVRKEFWHRAKGDRYSRWRNVVKTPVSAERTDGSPATATAL